MATIALRMPTALPGQSVLPNGQCYVLLPVGTVSVRELIREKVRAEYRKARAGGMVTSSLPLLLPAQTPIGFSPLEEQLAVAQACRAFNDGVYLVLVDGRPVVDLDQQVELSRATTLLFVHVPHEIDVSRRHFAAAA